MPIVVVLPERSDRPDWLEAPSVTTDLPPDLYQRSPAATPDAPCLLSVERPQNLRVQHRILARDQVRSFYQSGVRTERNADYALAQAHVRDAERRAKEDGPDILHVGDPLLDLVGTLIGGVVSGFSRAGREDELNTAMAELAATPRWRDRPVSGLIRAIAIAPARRRHSDRLARSLESGGVAGPPAPVRDAQVQGPRGFGCPRSRLAAAS